MCLQHCSHVAAEQNFTRTALAWASAHGDKWGQLHPLMENGRKIKKRKHAEKSSFLCLCYILRAIRTGRCTCRERRYSDQIFIQMYFRMHHFVVKFSKFSSPQAARGIDPPQPKSCGRSCALAKIPNPRLKAGCIGTKRELRVALLLSNSKFIDMLKPTLSVRGIRIVSTRG